jgi:hypothetical protein
VYAFTGDTWSLQQQLTAAVASAAGDQFGDSVSLSSDGATILIGEDSKSTAGAGYFFATATASPSPSPTAAVLPAVPPTGVADGSELPGLALLGGLAMLLIGAVAWRRRTTLP